MDSVLTSRAFLVRREQEEACQCHTAGFPTPTAGTGVLAQIGVHDSCRRSECRSIATSDE
jgi:hypothetical protein